MNNASIEYISFTQVLVSVSSRTEWQLKRFLSQCNIYAVGGGPLDVSPLVACQKALVKGDYLSGGHSHIFLSPVASLL